MEPNKIRSLIKGYGGTTKMARVMKVTTSTVKNFMVNNDVPLKRIVQLATILGVKPHELTKWTEIIAPNGVK